jgi:hypothetical protein
LSIFLLAYLGGRIVAMQPMASMQECRAMAAEASRQLNEMVVEQVETEREGNGPTRDLYQETG